MWSGPIPSPEDLQQYEHISPGSAQRILEEYSAQSSHMRELDLAQFEHRRALENLVVQGTERRSNIGQWLASGLAVSSVVVAAIVATVAHAPNQAVVIMGAVLATGGIVYIVGGRPPKDS